MLWFDWYVRKFTSSSWGNKKKNRFWIYYYHDLQLSLNELGNHQIAIYSRLNQIPFACANKKKLQCIVFIYTIKSKLSLILWMFEIRHRILSTRLTHDKNKFCHWIWIFVNLRNSPVKYHLWFVSLIVRERAIIKSPSKVRKDYF